MSGPDVAFFQIDGDGWMVGSDAARGPWSPNHCHAGPVSGLMARAAEALAPDKQLCRLTVDIMRAVPLKGIKVDAALRKSGRTLTTIDIDVKDREGRLCCRGNSLHMAKEEMDPVPSIDVPCPKLAEAIPGPFPLQKKAHSLPSFSFGCEAAYPPGENRDPGPTTIWLKTPSLVVGEATSPFQSLCPIADCGNAFSRNAEPAQTSFMNLDLTVHMFRPPESRWIASSSHSFWQSSGIGLSRALLFDESGPVGQATQTLMLRLPG